MIAWDADAVTDARSYFVNQSAAQAIAYGWLIWFRIWGARDQAQVAIVTTYMTTNQNIWIEHDAWPIRIQSGTGGHQAIR